MFKIVVIVGDSFSRLIANQNRNLKFDVNESKISNLFPFNLGARQHEIHVVDRTVSFMRGSRAPGQKHRGFRAP